MTSLKIVASLAALGAALVIAAPASAVISTLAKFSTDSTAANFRFVNTGNSANRTTDATFYTTSSATATKAGSVIVDFSFLQAEFLPYVTNLKADFSLAGSIAKGSAAQSFGGFLVQPGASGTFKFLSTTVITVGGPNFIPATYAIGSVLLAGSFTSGTVSGQTSSGGLSDSNISSGSTVTFSSDFLDFTPTLQRDLSLAITAILPSLAPATGVNKALKSFRGVAGGQFSSDPAPLINGLAIVPEPAVWGLLVVGFGLVGVQVRRRRRSTTVAA